MLESEKEKDDPSSPYSVNYSGEFSPNKVPGYSLILADKNGQQTGYLQFTGPGGSGTTKLSWPRNDKGRLGSGNASSSQLSQQPSGVECLESVF